MHEDIGFKQRIYRLVAEIPPGCVASYGQLALLAGAPRWARRVGRAMRTAPAGLPCHRVVNAAGRTAPGWAGQRRLLEKEGVRFGPSGRVDMKKHRWQRLVTL
ncbi:MAG: MGMT family protein [Oscillospiraceae bacterium]